MAIGVILIGGLVGDPHHENGEEIVCRVDGRLEGIAENGKRVGLDPDAELYYYDDDVGDENAAQDPAHPGRFFPRVYDAGHGGSWEVPSRKSRVLAQTARRTAPFRYPVSGMVKTSGWSFPWPST